MIKDKFRNKMTHRIFTAIRIKPNQEIRNLIKYLSKFNSTKTVEPENLHLNLKFLGEVKERELEKAKKAIKKLRGFGEFKAELSGTGAFPNKEYIKVIWIGVKTKEQEINKLARKTEKIYIDKEFQKRDKEYKPHITVARVKTKPDKKIREVFDKYDKTYKEIKIDEVELIESELTKKGPIYKTIEKVKL